jgi:hypothetical protein
MAELLTVVFGAICAAAVLPGLIRDYGRMWRVLWKRRLPSRWQKRRF